MTLAVAVLAGAVVVALALAGLAFVRASRARRQLRLLADYDPLTGLPNRRQLAVHLEEMLRRARRRNARVAVLMLELRGFAHLNEAYGHEVGDALMEAASKTLRSAARHEDVLVRYGGPRFVVTCPDVPDPTMARTRAVELLEAVQHPFEVGPDRIRIGASVGIALADENGTSEAVLLDAAVALEEALERGKGAVELFDHSARSSTRPSTAEHRLRQALDNGEFWLLYLPVLRLADHRIVGVEALLRWADPEHGLVSPGRFLRSLEHTGLIIPVGNWVMREAARQSKVWQDQFPDHPDFETTINVSPRQLVQSDFFDNVVVAIEESNVDPHRISLEITQGSLVEDPDEAWSMLRQAKQLGCRLALDDFGTGYSSFADLRQFKVDHLKIDPTFVRGLPDSPEDVAIVRHIVGLARALRIEPVAEGIESPAQAGALLEAGCAVGQGYYFSTPQPADVITELLHKGSLLRSNRPNTIIDLNRSNATVVMPNLL